MVRSLTTALTTAKNLSEQSNLWLWLMEITISPPLEDDVVLRLAQSTADVSFSGQTWTRFPFTLGVQSDDLTGELHEVEVAVGDLAGNLREFLKRYDIDGAAVRLLLVYDNGATFDQVLEERFVVVGQFFKIEHVQLRLASRSMFEAMFPSRTISRHRCAFTYKGPRCKYIQDDDGTVRQTCDFSLDGPNGCQVHDNAENFGGFPNVPQRRG